MLLGDVASERILSSNSEDKEEEGSDSASQKEEVVNTADDAWRFYTQAQCEKILDSDPFNMQARFRSAQIWIKGARTHI